MLFNSIDFFLFLFFIFTIHWSVFCRKKSQENLIILIASYLFYSFWDWRFLFLIIASTLFDYFIGLYIYSVDSKKKRKIALLSSIIFNLGILGFFKYFNFFIDSWVDLLLTIGYTGQNTSTLQIILPVGISFYTFQTMSYTIDVYRNKISPTKDLIAFATFVSFFPQLVAGPIEKASNLLPQIIKKRVFNYKQSTDGLRLILWGLFKKVAIADALSPIVDDIFTNYANYSASTLVIGAFLFSFQMYGDFSGYSDIAIGTAKLFGIELMSNFKFPNFSRNVAEHWQRWHISLTGWFKEYLYIPLGGSRGNTIKSIRNIIIIFLISGLWHGANWTFLIWGALHAVFYISVFLAKKNRTYSNSIVAQNSLFPSIVEIAQIIFTFSLVSFARIFFRSKSTTDAFLYIKQFFSRFEFEIYQHPLGYRMIDYFILIILFVIYEFRIRKDEREPFKFKSKAVRFIAYTLVIFGLLLFFDDQVDKSFIYFQF